MNNKFDQMTKSVAQSVTRRQSLTRFGLGLAAIALTGFGFVVRGRACLASGSPCDPDSDRADENRSCNKCCSGTFVCNTDKPGNRKCVCE